MRLHAAHLPAARAAALLAALAGPVAAQEAPSAAAAPSEPSHVGAPMATASIIDGLTQVAKMPITETLPGSDLCEVVRGDGLGERVWTSETPQAASLFLWVENRDGTIVTGSGTIVAGSDAGQGNRVVSAAHVFEDKAGRFVAKRVLAFGEDGVLLASLTPVDEGKRGVVGSTQVVQEVRGDWAVLEPSAWFGVEASAWNAMGAPLADTAPVDAMIIGQPGGTALIAPGASGGAMFDEDGAIVGVVIQALSSSDRARMGKESPFIDSLFFHPTGDTAFDMFVASDRFVKKLGGMPEQVGSSGLAIPIVGAPRVLLGAEEPTPLGVDAVFGTMTVFPAGECRTGAVVAYPRMEIDRLAGHVITASVEPIAPDRAWSLVQGLGWYPEKGPLRVQWQALRGMEDSGQRVPAQAVMGLLSAAKQEEGRVGLEATRIEAGLVAGTRQEAADQARYAQMGDKPDSALSRKGTSRPTPDPATR